MKHHRSIFLICLVLNVTDLSSQIFPSGFQWAGCRYNYNSYKTPDTIVCKKLGYELIFEDTFDSTALNTEKWQTSYPWGPTLHSSSSGTGWEREIYTKENVSVKGGYLYLHTKIDPGYRQPEPGASNVFFKYTSGMVSTKVDFQMGKFEIRAKIPQIVGLWPAFWLYGYCAQEIDVFELLNSSETSNSTEDGAHQIMTYHRQYDCKDPVCNSAFTKDFKKDLSADFHVYTLEWNEDKIIWKTDGEIAREVYRLWALPSPDEGASLFEYAFPVKSCSELKPATYYSTVEAFVLNRYAMRLALNTAVSFDRAGNAGILPQDFVIDYVRVWKETEESVLDQSNTAHDLKVYPNPTTGKLTVSKYILGRKALDIVLFDELGCQVDAPFSDGKEDITFDLNRYAKGMYVLKLRTDYETYFKKIICY